MTLPPAHSKNTQPAIILTPGGTWPKVSYLDYGPKGPGFSPWSRGIIRELFFRVSLPHGVRESVSAKFTCL